MNKTYILYFFLFLFFEPFPYISIIMTSCSRSCLLVHQSLPSKVSNFINFGHSPVIQKCRNDVNSHHPPHCWPSSYISWPFTSRRIHMMTLVVPRCGGMYCGIHRYSDKHSCTFDYGALGKSEIAAANPVIVAEKVAKI